MVYVTGDCHGDFRKFDTKSFPDQKQMTRDDFVIICGDFAGVWYDSPEEHYWLNWLNNKPFTTLFVDGNHENFDRLTTEFEEIDYHGGRAHRIRENIYHLMRGYVFSFEGIRFFCFGGAQSHDIQDGVLEPDDPLISRKILKILKNNPFAMYRINHISWWKEEMPSKAEYDLARSSLERCGYDVDFVISHCAPTYVLPLIQTNSSAVMKKDELTDFFDNIIDDGIWYDKWYCGHYHVNQNVADKIVVLYDKIERIV